MQKETGPAVDVSPVHCWTETHVDCCTQLMLGASAMLTKTFWIAKNEAIIIASGATGNRYKIPSASVHDEGVAAQGPLCAGSVTCHESWVQIQFEQQATVWLLLVSLTSCAMIA